MNAIDAFLDGIGSAILRIAFYFGLLFLTAYFLTDGGWFPLILLPACASWGAAVPIAWILSIVWIPYLWAFVSDFENSKNDLFIGFASVYILCAPDAALMNGWLPIIGIFVGITLIFYLPLRLSRA